MGTADEISNITEEKFNELKGLYKLDTPEQIQMRIIWIHLKQLTLQTFGDTAENKAILDKHDSQWKLCESIISQRQ